MIGERPQLVQKIDKCPVCGSTERYAESMANEVKDRGLMDLQFEFYYESVMKVIEQPDKAARIPIGSMQPIMFIHEDICLGWPNKPCGNRYAVKLERGEVMKLDPGPAGLELPRS